MIISMKLGATKAEIDHVCERLQEFGYKAHPIVGEERTVIGGVGGGSNKEAVMESIAAAPRAGVSRATRRRRGCAARRARRAPRR